jgi:hypothetical protein
MENNINGYLRMGGAQIPVTHDLDLENLIFTPPVDEFDNIE